jgi:uncharacterized protein (DUF2062 family)
MTKIFQNSLKIRHQLRAGSRAFLSFIYNRFLRLRGTPRQISMGLALGVFIGMTPFIGFHTLIAVTLASLFAWNKVTSALGVFITNPLTAPIIYPITYKLGSMITGFSDPTMWLKVFEPGGAIDLLKGSPMILVDLIVGGILIGIPLSFFAYHLSYRLSVRTKSTLVSLRKKYKNKKSTSQVKRIPL